MSDIYNPSASGSGSGSVTNVSGTNANGVTFSISNPTTTPNITISLGAITPTSVVIGTLGYTDTGILESAQSSTNSYNQIILQNTNAGATASADFIVNNNNSTASTYYGDFGMNSSGFTGSGALNQPNYVYLTATSGDLVCGTTTSNGIHFVVNSGATDAMAISSAGAVTIPAFSTAGIVSNNASGVLSSTANPIKRTVGAGAGVPGSGTVVPTGRVQYTQIPYSGTITGFAIMADQSGSIVVDIWKANAAIPTVANTITASALPALSSSQYINSTTLTGWTTSVTANDVFAFNVNSASTINSFSIVLFITTN